MPHAITPEPTAEKEDVVLPDAPASPDSGSSNASEEAPGSVKANEKTESDKENVKLDDMFDGDEDDEFSFSAPTASAEAPQTIVYSAPMKFDRIIAEIDQTTRSFRKVLRPRDYESILSTSLSLSISLPMAESFSIPNNRLCTSGVRVYATK